MRKFAFYLDLDGVLADYETGIRRFGFEPDPELNKSTILLSGTNSAKKRERYEAIKGTDFFRFLPLYDGAISLFNRVCDFGNPVILTAAPKFGSDSTDFYTNPYWAGAAYHKRIWVERELGITSDDDFVCTVSSLKHRYIGHVEAEHHILIDDRPSNIDDWVKEGGIGILHTDPADSIRRVNEIVEKILANEIKNVLINDAING